MTSRTILLRRPPVLSLADGVFVPDHDLAEVDQRWAALCARNPAFYDGRLCHVLGVHRNGHGGAAIHVADCAYRFHAVQDEGFDLGVRPLGVKGISMCNGKILLGRRSRNVASYGGMWEFAPAGAVEPSHDPAVVVVEELREETGYEPVAGPTALAILYDPVLRCWEIVFAMTVGKAGGGRSAEYDELAWCAVNELPGNLSPIAQQIVPLVQRQVALEARRDVESR